jgi:hypothetical protein
MAETGHGGKAEAAGHGGPACYGGRQAIPHPSHSFIHPRERASKQAARRSLAPRTD